MAMAIQRARTPFSQVSVGAEGLCIGHHYLRGLDFLDETLCSKLSDLRRCILLALRLGLLQCALHATLLGGYDGSFDDDPDSGAAGGALLARVMVAGSAPATCSTICPASNNSFVDVNIGGLWEEALLCRVHLFPGFHHYIRNDILARHGESSSPLLPRAPRTACATSVLAAPARHHRATLRVALYAIDLAADSVELAHFHAMLLFDATTEDIELHAVAVFLMPSGCCHPFLQEIRGAARIDILMTSDTVEGCVPEWRTVLSLIRSSGAHGKHIWWFALSYEVSSTLPNSCSMNCLIFDTGIKVNKGERSCHFLPYCCGWDAPLQWQPWPPPPMQVEFVPGSLDIRPTPWPPPDCIMSVLRLCIQSLGMRGCLQGNVRECRTVFEIAKFHPDIGNSSSVFAVKCVRRAFLPGSVKIQLSCGDWEPYFQWEAAIATMNTDIFANSQDSVRCSAYVQNFWQEIIYRGSSISGHQTILQVFSRGKGFKFRMLSKDDSRDAVSLSLVFANTQDLINAMNAIEISGLGLDGQVSAVSACSHVGDHKYAGNVIIFSSNAKGAELGHWFVLDMCFLTTSNGAPSGANCLNLTTSKARPYHGAESIIHLHDPLLLGATRSLQFDYLFQFVRYTTLAIAICRYAHLHWQQSKVMIWCWNLVPQGLFKVIWLLPACVLSTYSVQLKRGGLTQFDSLLLSSIWPVKRKHQLLGSSDGKLLVGARTIIGVRFDAMQVGDYPGDLLLKLPWPPPLPLHLTYACANLHLTQFNPNTYSQARGRFDPMDLCTIDKSDAYIIIYDLSGLGASRLSRRGECQPHGPMLRLRHGPMYASPACCKPKLGSQGGVQRNEDFGG